MSVPSDDGVWFPEQEGVSPVGKAAGNQNDQDSLAGTGLRLFDASGCDHELLSKQIILLEELLPRSSAVDEQAAKERRAWTKRLA